MRLWSKDASLYGAVFGFIVGLLFLVLALGPNGAPDWTNLPQGGPVEGVDPIARNQSLQIYSDIALRRSAVGLVDKSLLQVLAVDDDRYFSLLVARVLRDQTTIAALISPSEESAAALSAIETRLLEIDPLLPAEAPTIPDHDLTQKERADAFIAMADLAAARDDKPEVVRYLSASAEAAAAYQKNLSLREERGLAKATNSSGQPSGTSEGFALMRTMIFTLAGFIIGGIFAPPLEAFGKRYLIPGFLRAGDGSQIERRHLSPDFDQKNPISSTTKNDTEIKK